MDLYPGPTSGRKEIPGQYNGLILQANTAEERKKF